MTSQTISDVIDAPAAVLCRHAHRRSSGIPTVSVLVGPFAAAVNLWRRWCTDSSRTHLVTTDGAFPTMDFVRRIAERFDLVSAAIGSLAQRSGREANEFRLAWRCGTGADRGRLFDSIVPATDDDLRRALAGLDGGDSSSDRVAATLIPFGERAVPIVVQMAPAQCCPGVLLTCHSMADLSRIAETVLQRTAQILAVPTAVSVPAEIWDEYRTASPESRAKAILREGEIVVRTLDRTEVETTLREAGASEEVVAAVAPCVVDSSVLESAVAVVRVTASEPSTESEVRMARSAAEQLLFDVLESIPETAGRFELNGTLDFRFGPRAAEVDLLCRSERIAIELDGFFHFVGHDSYRRDREKDWELQRRGYTVLRFLSEDVPPRLEMIRDRILEAVTLSSHGEQP